MDRRDADLRKHARIDGASLRARWRRYLSNRKGSTAVEFALVLPVLALLLLGVLKFGIAFSNYIQLANAASAGARQL